MKITFKLYASLTDYLPPEARRGNRIELEVAPDATIAQIIEPYGMPIKLVHLVLVNGVYIPPSGRSQLGSGPALTHEHPQGRRRAASAPPRGRSQLGNGPALTHQIT